MKEPIKIRNILSILPLVRKWQRSRQENFLTITLNSVHELIKVHHVTKGIVNQTIIHPRECFYPTIKDLATSVIFVHNHPSGSAQPSKEDDKITQRLGMAAEIMGLHLLDHIIITPGIDFYSYRQAGKIPVKYKPKELSQFVASLSNRYGEEP